MKVIVGLGNVGSQYAHTYHNLGFLAVEYLANLLGTDFAKKQCDSLIAFAERNDEKIILVKPQTMMNLSGRAVEKVLKFYKVDTSNLIVIYDDVDIIKGEIKYRQRGSGGTHNGMRDIVLAIGEEFSRIKIGVGRPPEHYDLARFILSTIPLSEREIFLEGIKQAAAKALEVIVE